MQRKKSERAISFFFFFVKSLRQGSLKLLSKIRRYLVSAEVEHTAAEGGDTGEAAGNNDGG